MKKKKKIGVFGGTFNPVHKQHIFVAEQFVKKLSPDKCLFVPAHISPFKVEEKSEEVADDNKRLKMLQLALERKEKLEIETYEIEKKGISYTYETLEYLRQKYENSKLYLLIGADQAESFKKWKNWARILKLSTLCIVERPNYEIKIERLLADAPKGTKQPIILNIKTDPISSTEIREKFQKGNTISGAVPQKVRKYINEKNLY